MVKRLNVVADSQRPGWSVLVWRGLLQIWNRRFLQQPFLIVKLLNVVHDNQNLWSSVLIWKGLLRIWHQRFLQQPFSCGETSQCYLWQPKPTIIGTDLKGSALKRKPMVSATTIFLWCPRQPKPKIIGTDLKRSASNLKQTVSATTFLLRWDVSMLSMSAKDYDHRYWFERSASKLKPTVSVATIFSWWKVSMLCMTTTAYDNRYWFEEVCFEPGTNGFCSNNSLMVRRLNVVHDSQNVRSSVLIWRHLLRIRNQQFLQRQFDFCVKSQWFPIQPKS